MSKINLMLGSAFILLLQNACIGDKPPIIPPVVVPPITVPEHNVSNEVPKITPPPMQVGIGLERGNTQNYPTHIEGSYYYGQVVIEPTLTREALKGPEAQTFFNHISNLLGESKQNFGLSVTPIIDGQIQPDIVLFNYAYDSNTKSWITYLNEEPRTPMVLLKPGTSLSFELKYISVDGKTFNMVKELSKDIYGATILVSGASIPYIDLIANKVSNLLSSTVSSSTVLSFNPISQAKKSVEYHVKTKSGKKLATVKFSLLLRDSVVSGAVIDSQLNQIPKVNNFTNPLNAVYTSYTNTFTLNDQLQKDESILSFSQINNPENFRTKCRKVLDRLETYSLNVFDRYNAFSQILEGTNFLQKHNLFHSGCLSQPRLDLLAKMGINLISPPSPILPRIEISDNSLTNLGSYMLNPLANVGFKSDLLKMFSKTLIIQDNELMNFDNLHLEDGDAYMSANELMAELGKIGVARFGIYNSQRKRHARFFFRPLNSETLYRIKLKRVKEWGKINAVVIESFEDDDIKSTAKQRKKLRVAADTKVQGYKTDILRKENQITLASNN